VILSVTVLFSFCIVLFTHLPVTADRSVSVFMLGYMNHNSNQVYTQSDIEKVFNEVYIADHNAIDKRLQEQIISGNISKNGDTYQITNQGKFLMDVYIQIADLFKLDKKNLSI
jgi:CTP-dependent riboflavin kinase